MDTEAIDRKRNYEAKRTSGWSDKEAYSLGSVADFLRECELFRWWD